ncbi:MAG: glycosyl transferase [Hyphobacterium sp.]|nr:MAG: glycosyl transferase [Hyphobacterium sp.]
MTGPAISAVMVSYRTGPTLLDAIDALLADPEIAELILVDHDNPAEIRTRLDQIAGSNVCLKLIRTNENLGFSKGCNIGAAAASHDWLFFINPDAKAESGAASKLVAALSGAQEPAIAGARILNEDGSEQRGSRRRQLTLWTAITAITGLARLGMEQELVPSNPIAVPAISGAAFAVSAEGFRTLGGFDDGYFLHVEDIDICRRAATVLFVPDAIIHHAGGTSRTSRFFVEFEKAKSFLRYFWKFNRNPGGRVATILAAPFLVVTIMLRAIILQAVSLFRS